MDFVSKSSWKLCQGSIKRMEEIQFQVRAAKGPSGHLGNQFFQWKGCFNLSYVVGEVRLWETLRLCGSAWRDLKNKM